MIVCGLLRDTFPRIITNNAGIKPFVIPSAGNIVPILFYLDPICSTGVKLTASSNCVITLNR